MRHERECPKGFWKGFMTSWNWLFFKKINLLIILHYNIVLVLPYIDLNPPWVFMCSLSWTPSHLFPHPIPSGSSQCTIPEHPASCIEPGLVIHFTYDNLHVLMPFSHVIPPSPPPTESKRLFYPSVSLLLLKLFLFWLSRDDAFVAPKLSPDAASDAWGYFYIFFMCYYMSFYMYCVVYWDLFLHPLMAWLFSQTPPFSVYLSPFINLFLITNFFYSVYKHK